MGQDDDADCVEHVWAVTEVNATLSGADQTHTCTRCGTPAYEASQAQAADRPPL